MPAKPFTQKQFKAFQTHVDKRFDAFDERTANILRLIDSSFERFRNGMMRFLDDKFAVLDRTAKRIEDYRQEQIMIREYIERWILKTRA